jgi:hypothetical protein
MWTIGQKVDDGWTVDSGPCATRDTAMVYGSYIKDGTRWTVKQSPGGSWFVLIK